MNRFAVGDRGRGGVGRLQGQKAVVGVRNCHCRNRRLANGDDDLGGWNQSDANRDNRCFGR
jgi:hypothetical protein